MAVWWLRNMMPSNALFTHTCSYHNEEHHLQPHRCTTAGAPELQCGHGQHVPRPMLRSQRASLPTFLKSRGSWAFPAAGPVVLELPQPTSPLAATRLGPGGQPPLPVLLHGPRVSS